MPRTDHYLVFFTFFFPKTFFMIHIRIIISSITNNIGTMAVTTPNITAKMLAIKIIPNTKIKHVII